jgi:hypothetical protein
MLTLSQSPALEQQLNHGWLRAVRIFALCSLLAILVPWYAALVYDLHGYWGVLLVPLLFSPFWFPFVWIFWRLASTPDSFIIKRTLALAISWGLFTSLFSSFFVVDASFSGDLRQSTVIPIVIAIAQIFLIISAVKAYYSLKRESGDLSLLASRLGVTILVLVVIVILIPNMFRPMTAANEASAIGSLRAVNIAQSDYAKVHPDKGFAASLAELGPSPGSELIDGVLAGGKKVVTSSF